jgi:hypothetical protein
MHDPGCEQFAVPLVLVALCLLTGHVNRVALGTQTPVAEGDAFRTAAGAGHDRASSSWVSWSSKHAACQSTPFTQATA